MIWIAIASNNGYHNYGRLASMAWIDDNVSWKCMMDISSGNASWNVPYGY
jgi:hypothetical protein